MVRIDNQSIFRTLIGIQKWRVLLAFRQRIFEGVFSYAVWLILLSVATPTAALRVGPAAHQSTAAR